VLKIYERIIEEQIGSLVKCVGSTLQSTKIAVTIKTGRLPVYGNGNLTTRA